MATVNLGRIKPIFKGAYAGGTAYVVDDIVTSGNETFICILASTGNATSNATYWTKLASKGVDGTNGTDLTSTLTTQGDVVYRDGSGLQRLAKPASNKMLQNTSGGVLSWETPSGGKVLQVVSTHITAQYSSSSSAFVSLGLPVFTITPSATSSKILLMAKFSGSCQNWVMLKFKRDIGGGGYADFGLPSTATGNQSNAHFGGLHSKASSDFAEVGWDYLDSPSTVSAVSYQIWGASHDPNTIWINRTYANANYPQVGGTTSSVTLMEIGV